MLRIYVGLFLMASATLTTELLLIRVFDVILTSNIGFMVLTSVMFAFGLSGIFATLRPLSVKLDVHSVLARLAVLNGLSTLAILPLMNLLPFDLEAIPQEPLRQTAAHLAMYLVLITPFFLAGLIFNTLFTTFPRLAQRLYFSDLSGAAVGCLLLVPLLPPIGPGGLLFWAAAFAFLASGLFSGNRSWTVITFAVAAMAVAVPHLRSPKYFDFVEHMGKRGVKEAREAGRIELTRWDPISKIDVIDLTRFDPSTGREIPGTRGKHLAYDGGAQSSTIFHFDGDFGRLREHIAELHPRQFWRRAVLASHYLKRDTGQKVLILGSAAGQEIKAAIMYGASHVDAVELVGTVVHLMKNRYAEFSGNIYNHPRVHPRAGEGRAFLRSTDERYDIIQIFSNHTTSSIASGTGAMATNYLQTAEAYEEYFRHLNENGVLQVNHLVYPKMVTTAALAWRRMGRSDFKRHVLVFERGRRDYLPTFLVKNKPWTADEVAAVKDILEASKEDGDRLVEDPLHAGRSFLDPVFYSGDADRLVEVAAEMGFRILPATDDKPFFNFLRKRFGLAETDPEHFMNEATSHLLNSQIRRSVPMDVIHLMVTAGLALFFIVLFILLPLNFSRAGRVRWPFWWSCLLYFSCLGAGFIILELVFIHLFMHFIGFPLYAYTTVVFTLLAAAGAGSFFSSRWSVSPRTRWRWPFIGALAMGALLLLAHPYVFAAFLGYATAIRIGVAFLMLFPLGFFLGMPFPLGILALEKQPRGAIAWAWGMNGLFTVVGGIVTILMSVYLGFKTTLAMALLLYVLAFWTFSRVRRLTL